MQNENQNFLWLREAMKATAQTPPLSIIDHKAHIKLRPLDVQA